MFAGDFFLVYKCSSASQAILNQVQGSPLRIKYFDWCISRTEGKTQHSNTLNRVQQHFRSSTGPASRLPEMGLRGGRRGVRRHVLHFNALFKHFLQQRSLGLTVLHFGSSLFLLNIQVVQNCCKFKSYKITKYDKGRVHRKESKPPQTVVFKDYWRTRKKSFIQIISWNVPRHLMFNFPSTPILSWTIHSTKQCCPRLGLWSLNY